MVIPKDQVTGYKRWQVDSFDKPAKVTQPPPSKPSSSPESVDIPTGGSVSESVVDMPFPTAEALAKINDDARAEGYQAGYDEGRAAGEAELALRIEEQVRQLSGLVGNLQVALAHLDQDIGEQLLDLGLEVAAQVLRSSLAADRELLLPIVHEALGELPFHHGAISLHMNPLDAEALHDSLKEQLTHTGAHLVADNSISAGGIYLKAGSSEIDGTMETRWRRVLEAIGVKNNEWLKKP